MAGLADLQHQAGDLGDGLEEVVLLRVAVEHAVERLAELDELALGRRGQKQTNKQGIDVIGGKFYFLMSSPAIK